VRQVAKQLRVGTLTLRVEFEPEHCVIFSKSTRASFGDCWRKIKTQLSPRAYLENPEETALRLGRTRSGQQKDYLTCRFHPEPFDYRAAATAPGALAG